MKRLVIIGNGFDLHHKMKTSYLRYRDYLLETGRDDVVFCFEDESYDYTDRWTDMESHLGLIDYEKSYCYLLPYGSEEWRDSAHHDFQYEVEKKTQYWPDIKDLLVSWIRSIEYTQADDRLRKVVNNEAVFLSFNYTNTLERLYGIQKDRICYIHGDASQTEHLILGHRNQDYYPEWDPNNEDMDVRLLEAGEIMENHRLESMKAVEEIIDAHKQFFEDLVDIDEVYVLGLSYNAIDLGYFEQIASSKKQLKWYFNCYDEIASEGANWYIGVLGITDYEKIDIASW